MRKRVAFIVGTLQTGGIERSVVDWCLYLKDKTEWEPSVICVLKRSGPFLQVLEARDILVEECKLHQRGFTFRLKRLLKQLNPDVVHSQVAFSMPWQVLGIVLSGSRRIVFTQQNEYQNWNPRWARLRLIIYFKLFFRCIDHYTCVSKKVRNSLCSLTGMREDNFVIIPNSVDLQKFYPDPAIRQSQRVRFNWPPDLFVMGMVARFNQQKGHSYLIDAAAILKGKGHSFKLVLIGIGPLESEIQQRVEALGLKDRVLFFGQSEDIHGMLQAFDCFILPSLWEGMPLALLEAMAVGLPVIATDVAGTREVVEDGKTGKLIPPMQPDAIVNAIIELMSNPEYRKTLALFGLEQVRKNFSVASNVESYLSLYEK